ncbi:MAG TPA: YggS family pyridoxal phosphate-dependent enzyme [Kofleriaceae bacterium]
MTEPWDIESRWKSVRARVAEACERAGRAPTDVTIVAVSKTHPPHAICAAAAAGARDFGENYVQELVAKRAEVTDVRWHFIGRLQRNKVRFVAGQVALVHAVDTVGLAEEISKRAQTVQPILLAVNVAGEDTKGGVGLASALELAHAFARFPNVRLDGLMTMPPPSDDPEASRPVFEALRALRDQMQDALGVPLPVLSMGMSGDFEVAIVCGSTHVRIGTAIFGSRT